jgi:hypothetical protein
MSYLPGLASNYDPLDLCLLRVRVVGVCHWLPDSTFYLFIYCCAETEPRVSAC